jgi:replicative DNA helicase
MDIEQRQLARAIAHPMYCQAMVEFATRSDFSFKKHKIIFAAIKECYEKGVKASKETIVGYLAQTNDLEEAGGAEYIEKIVDDWITALGERIPPMG